MKYTMVSVVHPSAWHTHSYFAVMKFLQTLEVY